MAQGIIVVFTSGYRFKAAYKLRISVVRIEGDAASMILVKIAFRMLAKFMGLTCTRGTEVNQIARLI